DPMPTPRPVLLSDVRGARECLPPELLRTGLVEPENPAALAHLIAQALKDPIECERLGLLARERMSDYHDVRGVVRQVELLYRNLLRDGVPGPRAAGRRDTRVPERS
ncbi:glycosyltransferase, partial [Kitasatospora nipponensis]|uniref:glycosyltransferase n=1 Tax=Kitasatospora nipponensis TaxID=258049 RepID=UPI003CD0BA0C